MTRAFSRQNFVRLPRLIFRSLTVPTILAATLSACTQVGDFDRPVVSIRETASALAVVSDASALVSDASAYVEVPISDYTLTYKEERMRSLGYRLIQPLGLEPRYRDRVAFYRYSLAGFSERPLSDGDQYYEYLRQNHTRYEEALWNKLIGDILDDEKSARRFADAAESVLEQDAERLAIFSTRNRELPDHDDMVARIEENSGFIDLVTFSLDDRITAYRRAIDRAELESPSDLVYDARSRMDGLEYQYQQIVWIGGDGNRSTSAPRASSVAYRVIEPPVIDLSGN